VADEVAVAVAAGASVRAHVSPGARVPESESTRRDDVSGVSHVEVAVRAVEDVVVVEPEVMTLLDLMASAPSWQDLPELTSVQL